jgi:5-formyltetrahydrofolate cyclo-ligase
VEIVTIFLKKINAITQIALSLKNIAQERNVLQYLAKQNKQWGFLLLFLLRKNFVFRRYFMSSKSEFRRKMMERLKKIPEDTYNDLSARIAANVFKQPEWKHASVIGITISRPPEVDTYRIIKQAWREGKKVAVPKCLPENKEMEFRFITDFEQLEKIYFGLLEPIPEKTELVAPADIGLLFVPGLAFGTNGYRLGFGGGYYDRFLPGYNGETASLAFSIQIEENLPVEEHDIPVARIITEQRVILA